MGNSLVTRALEILWLDQNLKIFYKISIFRTTQKMTKVTKFAKSDPLSTILTRVLVILFQVMIIKALTSIWWNSKVDQAWNNMSKKRQSNGILSFHTTFLVKTYLYQFDLHSGKKESREENMGPSVVLIITESLQNSHSVVFLIISSTVPHLLWGVMIEICMVFAIPKRIGKECGRCLLTERWRQVIFSTCIPKRYLSVSGLTGVQ